MTTPDITPERAELVAAWNDLPDSIRCHPGLKRLFRAAQCIPSEAAPSLTVGEGGKP